MKTRAIDDDHDRGWVPAKGGFSARPTLCGAGVKFDDFATVRVVYVHNGEECIDECGSIAITVTD